MRLTLLAALVVSAGLVAGGAVVLALVRHDLMVNARMDALHRARAAAAMVATTDLPQTLPSTGEETAVVQVVDRHGRVRSASEELRGAPPLLTGWPDDGQLTATLRHAAFADDDDYVVVGVPASRAGEPLAVYAASSLEPVAEGVAATATALGVVVPCALVAVIGAAWLLVGRALRPVEAIRRQVAEITASQLDRRVPEPAVHDELGRLARTMNEMLARLQDAHERQRRFVGDASHELRTPLAAIRARIEVGLAHPAGTDWPSLARAVHREGNRLEQLVAELLLLSRGDDAAALPSEPVDLDELILSEVEQVRARGRVAVELAPFSAARVPGRPDELGRVVRNLLDNAERHARRTVRVGLSSDDRSAELVVADDGDGIAPRDRERVFERFFRLQAGRDRDTGGAGLGLAIVHEVVTGYGGRVWLADAGGGAEFHVRLPLSDPDSNDR